MKRGTGEAGFTFVELVLTITILTISAVMAVPYFADVGAAVSEGAAQKVLADLTYVRRLAKNRNGYYGISFDASGDSYTVYQCNASVTCTTKTTITDPYSQASMVINFSTQPGIKGTDLRSPSFGGTTEIRFDAQGFPRNASNVLLTSSGSVSFYRGGTTKTVTVQPNTGEVSLQ